jgi:hypothetical protein
MLDVMEADLKNAINKLEESKHLTIKWQGICEFLQSKLELEKAKIEADTEKTPKKQVKSKK